MTPNPPAFFLYKKNAGCDNGGNSSFKNVLKMCIKKVVPKFIFLRCSEEHFGLRSMEFDNWIIIGSPYYSHTCRIPLIRPKCSSLRLKKIIFGTTFFIHIFKTFFMMFLAMGKYARSSVALCTLQKPLKNMIFHGFSSKIH